MESKSYLYENACYKTGAKRKETLGVMVHSTATPGATPESFAKSWNVDKPNGNQVCVHAFVDDTKVINTLPYDIRCWGCGSGSSGSGNNSYIQIEICEPSEVYFVNGWDYRTKDQIKTKTYIDNMVKVLCDWIVTRLKELGISEVNELTVTSHYEAYKKGIATNHADPKGLLSLGGYTMDDIRDKCRAILGEKTITYDRSNLTSIMGESLLSRDKMIGYARSVNSNLGLATVIVDTYFEECAIEGVRADVAFAQSLLETGNYKFEGSAVELTDFNFCGLGVTQNGIKGCVFNDMRTGIKAHVQHLKAYASYDKLNDTCVDPRFNFVSRGVAEYVEWLGIQENPQKRGWAAGSGYGSKIINIMRKIDSYTGSTEKVDEYRVRTKSVMNIRKGAGTSYYICGKAQIGVYTIVETVGNWGRLKSGAGWIHLGWSERMD